MTERYIPRYTTVKFLNMDLFGVYDPCILAEEQIPNQFIAFTHNEEDADRIVKALKVWELMTIESEDIQEIRECLTQLAAIKLVLENEGNSVSMGASQVYDRLQAIVERHRSELFPMEETES